MRRPFANCQVFVVGRYLALRGRALAQILLGQYGAVDHAYQSCQYDTCLCVLDLCVWFSLCWDVFLCLKLYAIKDL